MSHTTRSKVGLDKRPPKKKGREKNPRPKRRDNDPRSDLLGLQQTSGNQAVNQLIQGVAGGSRKTAPTQVTEPETISTAGNAIDPHVRSRMESRFGHDFSDVRVHTDAAADKSATELGARAYTKGKDIVFAAGKYQPETVEGQQRLAHELTHVIQQQRSGNGRGRDNRLSAPHEESEREADAVSRTVMGGKRPPSIVAAGVGIQRDEAKHPLLDDFEKKFSDAAKAIRKNALALKLVTEAEAAGVKFGGFAEDGPGKMAWPYTIPGTQTVYVPKARTDATIAMSDFLFELNNAIRGPQLLGLQKEAAKGTKTKLTAKEYAYKILELEVEGMIKTGEIWFDMKNSLKDKKYDVYDTDFFLAEYKAFKAKKKTKDDIVKDLLKAPHGSDKSKTHEDFYVEQFDKLQKGK